MADLIYPQLSSGALAQYPMRKTTFARTTTNLLADGTLILFPDPGAAWTNWQLEYTNLSAVDVAALQSFFDACNGPLLPFTFLDPTRNLLASSSDLTAPPWQTPSLIRIERAGTIPLTNILANTVTNSGQSTQELLQTLPIPIGYQYCFSLYLSSSVPQEVTFFQRGSNQEIAPVTQVGPNWGRVWTQGKLEESGTGLTVGVRLSAGQQLSIAGMQLDAQVAPSNYNSTFQSAGVFLNAHFASEELQVRADGVDLFSATIAVQIVDQC